MIDYVWDSLTIYAHNWFHDSKHDMSLCSICLGLNQHFHTLFEAETDYSPIMTIVIVIFIWFWERFSTLTTECFLSCIISKQLHSGHGYVYCDKSFWRLIYIFAIAKGNKGYIVRQNFIWVSIVAISAYHNITISYESVLLQYRHTLCRLYNDDTV